MNRLLFEKTGDAVYLSHLDLMRVFQRAFKRADIMIWHSQGFSPRAYVSIALPLPVGSESVCEILDFEIQDGSVDLAKLPALLNRTMPAGIRVLEAYESAVKIKHLTRLRAQITLEYDRELFALLGLEDYFHLAPRCLGCCDMTGLYRNRPSGRSRSCFRAAPCLSKSVRKAAGRRSLISHP